MNNEGLFQTIQSRIQITQYSWKRRNIIWWNELPQEIRNMRKLKQFKGSLRIWVEGNVRLKSKDKYRQSIGTST